MPKSVKLNPTVSLRRLRELKCDQCGQIFYAALQLERHKSLHSKKPLICDVCGVTSTTRYYHRIHLLSHGRYPYHCDLCNQGFIKLSEVKRHRKSHDKEKTFLDQPSCPQSATSLAEPEIELSETILDITENCTLDPSLQLKPEDPGPSTVLCFEDTASAPLPALTTTVDTQLQLKGQQRIHTKDGKYPFSCGLRYHALLHDKKHHVSDQPLCLSGKALVEPKIEPSETALSSDTSPNYILDNSLQLKPEDPGPSVAFWVEAPPSPPASSLPVITATVNTLTPHSAPPPLSKDTDSFLPARAPRPGPAPTPSSQSPRAPPSVVEPATRTPPQLRSGPAPAMFSSFRLTSAFLEVKWNYKLLKENAARKKH